MRLGLVYRTAERIKFDEVLAGTGWAFDVSDDAPRSLTWKDIPEGAKCRGPFFTCAECNNVFLEWEQCAPERFVKVIDKCHHEALGLLCDKCAAMLRGDLYRAQEAERRQEIWLKTRKNTA